MNWISVKDKLPPNQHNYFVYLTDFKIEKGFYSNIDKYWVVEKNILDGEFYNDCDITHWMPLPKPPEDAVKFCGCLENCFRNGDKSWGHFGGIMCEHLSENNCGKTGEAIIPYFTQKEYNKLNGNNKRIGEHHER